MVKRAPADGGFPLLSSYISGTTAACGTTPTSITVPPGATSALIHAEGAAVYWDVNGTAAGTASPGYVAADMVGLVPAIDNFSKLAVVGVSGSIAHIEFYAD